MKCSVCNNEFSDTDIMKLVIRVETKGKDDKITEKKINLEPKFMEVSEGGKHFKLCPVHLYELLKRHCQIYEHHMSQLQSKILRPSDKDVESINKSKLIT